MNIEIVGYYVTKLWIFSCLMKKKFLLKEQDENKPIPTGHTRNK